MMDWNTSTYFSQHEFKCSHTGKCEMNPDFIDKLNDLRLAFGKPMRITSGFRDVTHPIEAKKKTSGGSYYRTSRRYSDIKRRCFSFVIFSIK